MLRAARRCRPRQAADGTAGVLTVAASEPLAALLLGPLWKATRRWAATGGGDWPNQVFEVAEQVVGRDQGAEP